MPASGTSWWCNPCSIDTMETIERWKEEADTIGWEEKASFHSISPRIDWISSSGLEQLNRIGAVGGGSSCQNLLHSLKIVLLSAGYQQFKTFLLTNYVRALLCQANSDEIWIWKQPEHITIQPFLLNPPNCSWWSTEWLRELIFFFFFSDFVVCSEASNEAEGGKRFLASSYHSALVNCVSH